MNIIEQSVEVLAFSGEEIIRRIEECGRICYKSENTDGSYSRALQFVENLVKRGHHSVLEHASITFKLTTNRGVTHELVRHRIASYSQSSTRYCNYSQDKFGGEITVIWPWFLGDYEAWLNNPDLSSPKHGNWLSAMDYAEQRYFAMLAAGCKPEEARGVLPNDLMTEIYVTMNIRELRHFFTLRGSKAAHPQIRWIAHDLLRKLRAAIPVVFDDIEIPR